MADSIAPDEFNSQGLFGVIAKLTYSKIDVIEPDMIVLKKYQINPEKQS
ncbi:hypothetical protein ACFSMW_17985 [Virgibacillus halophilus]|uniref:Uncharacterized protein n=1 Tax=Tigheibacillus halophilus TaxID=361280 RepID=A0ABU5C2G6_9BACI|nr:hypothetical protein [Virgibacillus halophilus]